MDSTAVAAPAPHAPNGQMTLEDRCQLILSVARALYVNGQATEQTVRTAVQLGESLGVRTAIVPDWGSLEIEAEVPGGRFASIVAAAPTGVDMDRVASVTHDVADVSAGRIRPEVAPDVIDASARTRPAPTWAFTLAAGAGAVALSVLFGVQHLTAAVLIFVSAAAGALLRRALGRYSGNVFVQPFCAALLAGIVGALAVRYNLSSSLRLVAVCPCMILVPGPHFLNGALDAYSARVSLGVARLGYAVSIVIAISVGLLAGLAALGISLPADPIGRSVPLWQDVIAAGVAVAAYSVFFSTPLYMLAWPIAVGMLAHALHWGAIALLGAGSATGALVACLIVGLILTPVSRRWHMPFAAIGFASVVSMMPGVFLFRTASALVQIASGGPPSLDLLHAAVADGMTAVNVIIAMSFGLIVPKMIIDRLAERSV